MTTGKVSRLFVMLASALVCLSSASLVAQQSTVSRTAPRIVEAVDESRLTKLPGNVPFLARAEFDQGRTSSSTPLTHLRLVLARSPEQEAALDQYLVDLQDKSSPNYHKWLTPEQYGKLYGPADSDIAALVAWLESHGFKLEEVSTGRTNIAFSGTVGQVEEAFHVRIHTFSANQEQFYSNVVDPSIPSALAAVVTGVAHLNTIKPRALHTHGMLGQYDPETKRMVPVSQARSGIARPELTTGTGTTADPFTLYMVAGDAATIYNTPSTKFNANYTGTVYDGTGVTIGIGGNSAILPATVADYRTRFLGDSIQPTVTNVDNVLVTGDEDEAYIDTQLAGSLAPGATIHFYTATDLISAINQAIADNTVDIFSLSFGACELNLGSANNTALSQMWQQAAGQGIAVTVSSGDSGAAACDANQTNTGANVPDAVQGLQVSGFASTPYNIAVGGTDFDGLLTSFSTYVGTTSATSGTQADFYRSALNYIPEATWNDSTSVDGLLSANVPYTGTNANIVAGGGGKSSCITQSGTGTCLTAYPKPYWQRGAGVPADSVRDLPDVSLMSGAGADNAAWLVCTDATGTVSGVNVTANCTQQSDGNFYFLGFGGTSTAAPAFAGILALVEQKAGGRLGQANKELYDLYNGAHAATIFHDTTIGNISVPCNSGTPNCVQNTAGNFYLSGYDTTTGYDLATGIGSVDATQLVTFWGTAVGATKATVSLTPSATTVQNTQSFTVATTVSGSSTIGTPTATVTLSVGTYTSAAGTLDNTGKFTFTVPAGNLVNGSNTITVTYSGDVDYASSTGTTTVTGVVPTPAVTLSATTLTFPNTVVGTAAPTQTVTITNSGTAPLVITATTVANAQTGQNYTATGTCGTVAIGGTCVNTVTFQPTAFGTLTATLSFTDNASGSPQVVNLTGVGIEAGSYTLAGTAVTVAPGSTGTSTVSATGTGGYNGSPITLSACVNATAPSGAVDIPACTITTASVTTGSSATSGTLSFGSTAASGAAKIAMQNSKGHWAGAGSIAIAGLFLLFGIPARSRKWRSMLGVFLCLAALGVLSGCGGSSKPKNPGTTAGAYTYTVTGTDAAGVKATATITVTVS